MKLNIETTDAAATLKVLQQVFTNEEVSVGTVYDHTADFVVKRGADCRTEVVYSAESIIELAAVIPAYKIRIY